MARAWPAAGWSAALVLGVSAAFGSAPAGYIDASTFGGGWNATDATACLQQALDTGQNVWVPKEASSWIVGQTIQLTHSNQELQFESGAVLSAMKNAFATPAALFNAVNLSGVTIEGNGAQLQMDAADYYSSQPGTRPCLQFWSCDHLLIDNLNIQTPGGAGITFGQGGHPTNAYVTVQNCDISGSDRNAISVLTADHLTIDHCTLENSGPHAPAAGIDIEPDAANRQLSNINITNSKFSNNYGAQIILSLGSLTDKSKPVSISFDNNECIDTTAGGFSNENSGVAVWNVHGGTSGSIDFTNMKIDVPEGTDAIDILNKSAEGARLSFGTSAGVNGATIVSRGKDYPILLDNSDETGYGPIGGIDLRNINFAPGFAQTGDFLYGVKRDGTTLTDLQGSFYFEDPALAQYFLTQPQSNVQIAIGQLSVPEPAALGMVLGTGLLGLMRRNSRTIGQR
jgi:hypothetical protein